MAGRRRPATARPPINTFMLAAIRDGRMISAARRRDRAAAAATEKEAEPE